MAIKAASWNIEGRLSPAVRQGRGTPAAIVEHILEGDMDVLFLPEAYGSEVADGIDERLADGGYRWFDEYYRDEGKPGVPGVEDPHNRFLSRLPVVRQETLRFGDVRTLQAIHVVDPTTQEVVCIIGIHFDDRLESRRLRQVEEVIDYARQQVGPIVLMGDFNALYGGTKRAILLRSRAVRYTGRLLDKFYIGTVLQRLAAMAQGTTLQGLHEALDITAVNECRIATTTPKMRQTPWLPSVRLLEIDHMLISSDLKATTFKVAADGGSDHRLISAVIEVPGSPAIAK